MRAHRLLFAPLTQEPPLVGPLALGLFRLLTSVRFALVLIGALICAALAGVLFPQVPTVIQDNPALRQAWLAEQAQRYGKFAPLLDRMWLFNVFQSPWFNALLAILMLSVSACTLNRFPPIWRSILHPRKRINDRAFRTSRDREEVYFKGSVGSFEGILKRHRYRVETSREGQVDYVYADKYRWSPLGTFLTHLALLLFLAGGLITWRLAESQDILVAEGRSVPVFGLLSGDHMQVELVDFDRVRDAQGRDLEYRSHIIVYKEGEAVAQGVTTVNDPLQYGGFKFHQVAFSEDGVALVVRESSTGKVVFDEVINLRERLPAPRLMVREGDQVVFDSSVPPVLFPQPGVYVAELPVSGSQSWAVGTRFEPDRRKDGPPFSVAIMGQSNITSLRLGETKRVDGRRVSFTGLSATKSAVMDTIPGGERVLVQYNDDSADSPKLVLVGLREGTAGLDSGGSVTVGEYTYEFGGLRSFAGLTVRKDPGTDFIWLATGLLLTGLVTTLHLPRRQLWARVSDGHLSMVGVGGKFGHLGNELSCITDKVADDTSGRGTKHGDD